MAWNELRFTLSPKNYELLLNEAKGPPKPCKIYMTIDMAAFPPHEDINEDLRALIEFCSVLGVELIMGKFEPDESCHPLSLFDGSNLVFINWRLLYDCLAQRRAANAGLVESISRLSLFSAVILFYAHFALWSKYPYPMQPSCKQIEECLDGVFPDNKGMFVASEFAALSAPKQ